MTINFWGSLFLICFSVVAIAIHGARKGQKWLRRKSQSPNTGRTNSSAGNSTETKGDRFTLEWRYLVRPVWTDARSSYTTSHIRSRTSVTQCTDITTICPPFSPPSTTCEAAELDLQARVS